MSTGRELMRVSDAERQAAADRLRAAHAEGRLDLLEYDTRLASAYQAVTYRDLDQLFTDLPVHPPAAAAAAAAAPAAARPVPAMRAPEAARTGGARRPTALKVLWTIWSCTVLVNLTVWLLVSVGNSEPDYFWPMWLLVPGAGLLCATVIVTAGRSRR